MASARETSSLIDGARQRKHTFGTTDGGGTSGDTTGAPPSPPSPPSPSSSSPSSPPPSSGAPPPVRRYRSTFASVCSFIIANEFCERLAFYGFQGSLVLFLKAQLGLSSASAAAHAAMWNAACYLTPLLGAVWADSVR